MSAEQLAACRDHHPAGKDLVSHADLILLLRWMDSEAYTTSTIVDAVEKPWNWLEELAQAKTDLALSVAELADDDRAQASAATDVLAQVTG